MASFTNIVQIRRPAQDVFAFLADLENVPKWNYAIAETRKSSPGQVGVGTTYEQVRLNSPSSRETLAITEFEPARHLTVEGTLARFPARLDYDVRDLDGRTELTNTVDLELTGAARILSGVAAGRIRAAVAQNFEVLRQLLEAEPRGAGR